MIPSSDHLQPGQIDAFTDHELPSDEARTLQQHIAGCHACSLRLLATIELKQATKEAGRRAEPSAAALARLSARLQPNTSAKPRRGRVLSFREPFLFWPALSAAAALLLVAVSLTTWSARGSRNALSAELLDQHLATLSATAAPQVLSTDRHTVKPWFEGKLPFSFNLPEPGALPAGVTLKGADLSYVAGHPAALLVFNSGKHQVSVFVVQSGSVQSIAETRSGFALRSATAGGLRFLAVGDVDASQLDRLLASLTSVQQPG